MAALDKAGFSATKKLSPLVGIPMTGGIDFWLEAGQLLQPNERRELAELGRRNIRAFDVRAQTYVAFGYHDTYGQYLACFPQERMVVVRQVRHSAKNADLMLPQLLAFAVRGPPSR